MVPPVLTGAVQLTVAEALPAVAVTPVGAPGTDACVSVTSSRYIQVSSGGLVWSWCTLNQSTTFWPAYGVMSTVTWGPFCELESLLNTLASVAPDVLRIWASCQSKVQPLPEQASSAVAGQYQKVRVVVPEGIATVWDTLLSPAGAMPGWTTPSWAEPLPEWHCLRLAPGVAVLPPVVQLVSALSKPPLRTCTMLADGVTALDCADSGPEPAGLDAVTVNVYVVPLVRPFTTPVVGAGFPVTVV